MDLYGSLLYLNLKKNNTAFLKHPTCLLAFTSSCSKGLQIILNLHGTLMQTELQ